VRFHGPGTNERNTVTITEVKEKPTILRAFQFDGTQQSIDDMNVFLDVEFSNHVLEYVSATAYNLLASETPIPYDLDTVLLFLFGPGGGVGFLSWFDTLTEFEVGYEPV
jgi:hypothetical protein